MKTTKATIKSFIRKNSDSLFINIKSAFDGMHDCCMPRENGFHKVTIDETGHENTLGVPGAWFVGSSRDYFNDYEDDHFMGFEIFNCCGKFILAIEK
ncbi:MAG TPA: hypothetical protein VMW32_12305 [Bacteroidales bacterium]|nr:hypothetical protein [Bacteroidales bacterium]